VRGPASHGGPIAALRLHLHAADPRLPPLDLTTTTDRSGAFAFADIPVAADGSCYVVTAHARNLITILYAGLFDPDQQYEATWGTLGGPPIEGSDSERCASLIPASRIIPAHRRSRQVLCATAASALLGGVLDGSACLRGVNRQRVAFRGVALAAGLAGLALLAGGCGGSKTPSVASLGSTHSTTSSSASAPLSPQKQIALEERFAACIDAHGGKTKVLPGGGIVSDVTPETSARLAAAQAICRKLVPMGSLSVPTQAQNARILAQMVKLAECMRAHGEPKFPDPTSNGIRISPGSGIDPNSPQFQAAQRACAKDSPGGP